MIVVHIVGHRSRAQLRRQLGGQILRKGLDLIVVAAALVELDAALLPDPALGVIAVGAELRGGGRQVCLADRAVEGRLADDLVEGIGVQRYLPPGQAGTGFSHPEGIVEGQRAGHLEEALQIVAAVLLQQLLDVLAVLGRLPAGQEGGEAPIADGPAVRVPLLLHELRFAEFVPAAIEIQYGDVLIHQNVLCGYLADHCHFNRLPSDGWAYYTRFSAGSQPLTGF